MTSRILQAAYETSNATFLLQTSETDIPNKASISCQEDTARAGCQRSHFDNFVIVMYEKGGLGYSGA